MQKGLISLTLATGLSLSAPAVAQDGRINPVGEWSASSDDESCTIERDFTAQSSGDTTLYLRSWGPDAPIRLSIVGPTMRKDDRAATTAEVGFNGDQPQGVIAIATSSHDQPMTYFQVQRPSRRLGSFPKSFGYLAYTPNGYTSILRLPEATDSLSVQLADSGVQQLQSVNFDAALAMLATCETRLAESWALDVAAERDLSRYPRILDGQNVAANFHRPDTLTRNHISWIAHVRLVVDAEGKVADCVLQSPSFSRRSTSRVCSRLEIFAEFEPALDKDGNPVAALYNASFLFARYD